MKKGFLFPFLPSFIKKGICSVFGFSLLFLSYWISAAEHTNFFPSPAPTVYIHGHIDVITGEFRDCSIDLRNSEAEGSLLLREYRSSDSWKFSSDQHADLERAFVRKKSGAEESFATATGQEISYLWENDPLNGSPRLKSAAGSFSPSCEYIYSDHLIGDQAPLIRIEQSDQTFLEVAYYEEGWNQIRGESLFLPAGDWRIGRVREQWSSRGPQNERSAQCFFLYDPGLTSVWDAAGNCSRYEYSDESILTGISHCGKSSSPYRSEKLIWEEISGEKRLCARLVLDGEGKLLLGRLFRYNERGKITEDILLGNLTGQSPALNIESLDLSDAERDTTSYTYSDDEACLLISQRCQSGLEIRYQYDAERRLRVKKILDRDQCLYRFFYAYDLAGNQNRIVTDDGSGQEEEDCTEVTERSIREIEAISLGPYQGRPERMVEKSWDPQSRTEVLQKETRIFYSPLGRRVEVYDYSVSPYRMGWWEEDSQGRVLKEGIGQQTLVWYEYDARGRCTSESKINAAVPSRSVYDGSGNLLYRSGWNPEGFEEIQRFQHDAGGNILKKTDHHGFETEYAYDDFGRLLSIQYPLVLLGKERIGHPQIHYAYNELNQVVSVIDPCGFETKWEYNIRGQPTRILYPDGTSETFVYTLEGALQQAEERNGIRHRFQRDGLQRILCVETLSSSGEILQIGSEEDSFYTPPSLPSLADKKSSSSVKSGKKKNPEQQRERHLPSGILVIEKETIDPSGMIKRTQTDAMGRVILEEKLGPFGEPAQHIEKIYDANGNLSLELHQRLFQGRLLGIYEIEQVHGPFGRIEEVLERSSEGPVKATIYLYNGWGQLDTLLKPDGSALFYEYDSWGRLGIFHAQDASFAYQYQYDERGRIVEVYDLIYGIDQSRSYNPSGTVRSETLAEGLTMQYEYDDWGRCEKVLFPDASGVCYRYQDQQLRHIQRTACDDRILYSQDILSYSFHGLPKEVSLIQGCGKVQWTFDQRGRPSSISSPCFEEKICASLGEGYPLSVTRKDPLGTSQISYSYDGEGRCISQGGAQPFSCSYDSLGNRFEAGQPSPTTNGLNQLSQKGERFFKYDANGNVIEAGQGAERTHYAYDGLNRLIRVTQGEQTTEYRYDSSDRRIARIRSNKGQPDQTEFFVYQGNDEIGSWNPEKGWNSLRILGIGSAGAPATAVAIEVGEEVYAPLYDLRGNLALLIDTKTKSAVEFVRYSLFGEEKIFDGKGAAISSDRAKSPWRFSGKRTDSETAFVYFGKRYYVPEMGRWLTTDPLGFADSAHLYQYLHNNPFRSFDRYGLYSWNEFWKSFQQKMEAAWYDVQNFFENSYFFCEDILSNLRTMRKSLDLFFEEFAGKFFLQLSGYYVEPPECGVWGEGEVDPLVRVSLINGILNLHDDCLAIAKMISETHGGVNVHFVFRPTQGLTWDLVYGFKVKLGYISPHAEQLAVLWRELIQEMGGADAGGIIYHFAHSLGVADSFAAKRLLSSEERGMIHVISFGSPSLDFSEEFASVIHYVSPRDLVPLVLDPSSWARAYFEDSSHIRFVNPTSWIPFVDHLMGSESYRKICQELGMFFVDQYGRILGGALV